MSVATRKILCKFVHCELLAIKKFIYLFIYLYLPLVLLRTAFDLFLNRICLYMSVMNKHSRFKLIVQLRFDKSLLFSVISHKTDTHFCTILQKYTRNTMLKIASAPGGSQD